MRLDVIQSDSKSQPWYSAGLRFTCTQCGNCCTGGPGYVWISNIEIKRLAELLELSTDQVIERYLRKIGDKYSLQETRNARGEHDCIFLKEEKPAPSANSDKVVYGKRVCTIYNARPLQCRTWPFWEGTMSTPDVWRNAAERCHGMNYGSRIFTKEEAEALRDAKDWPKKPPTSETKRKRNSK